MISMVQKCIEVPLMVGGGIKDPEKAYGNCKAGADLIVVGNAIEKNSGLIREISQAIHAVPVNA
jgi:putative glycerol-1-phosphate prenyltransferase